ncbi:hypothetical protein B0H14DRAFT_2952413 [Mycena olivaceomarginata]|nr:hypothetical protein B0H14DRAFT_2952413 [Mycena olivaceomarginata]
MGTQEGNHLACTALLSTFVVGIVACVNDVTDKRIPLILGAATNLVLTALTGIFSVFSSGRIFWIRRAASHVSLGSTFRSHSSQARSIALLQYFWLLAAR